MKSIIKNKIKHYCGRYPSLFFRMYRLYGVPRVIKECLLGAQSKLVIEGFPRSANTFSVVAFRQAQGCEVPMAHHLHAEAQILEGARKNIPVIALIRHPKDAVKSLMIREADMTQSRALKRYVQFYSAVKKVKTKVIIADFSEVTKSYGKTIKRLNDKFMTNYKLFDHTEENVHSVYQEIDAINDLLDEGKESHVARPSEERSEISEKVDIDENSLLMKEAVTLYEFLLEK